MQNDPIKSFEIIASKANQEDTTSIDVVDRVLAILHSRQNSSAPLNYSYDYMWIGAGSTVAACVAFIIFWFEGSDDSLLTFAQPFIRVLL